MPAAQLSFKLCLMRENRLDLRESNESENGFDSCDGEPGSACGVTLREGPWLGDGESMAEGGASGGVRLKLVPVGVGDKVLWPVRILRFWIGFLMILSALLSSFYQRLEISITSGLMTGCLQNLLVLLLDGQNDNDCVGLAGNCRSD